MDHLQGKGKITTSISGIGGEIHNLEIKTQWFTRILDLFDRYKNESGTLDKENLKDMFNGISSDVIDDIVLKFDLNGDRVLQKDEFINFCAFLRF